MKKYFIFSDDWMIIKKQVSKICDKLLVNHQDSEIIEFSFADNSMKNIMSNVFTISLFTEKRIFVLSDANFVTSKKTDYPSDFSTEDVEALLNYSGNDFLIFTCIGEKESKTSKLLAMVKKECKYLKLTSPTITEKKANLISKLVAKNIAYEEDAIDYFFLKIPDKDISIYNNETKRLVQLGEPITIALINSLVANYLVFDFFEIQNYFFAKKIGDFSRLYDDYVLANDSALGLLMALSKSICLLRNIFFLKREKYSNEEIANKLKQNPYRIKMLQTNNKFLNANILDAHLQINNILWNITDNRYDSKIIPKFELIKMMIN